MHELTKVSLKNYTLFTASGVMAGLVGMWTYFYLLKSGMTSKIVPIAASYPLITAILSIAILGEAVTLQRVIGSHHDNKSASSSYNRADNKNSSQLIGS